MVTINDTKLETLRSRIIRGLEVCNNTWQRARGLDSNDPEYKRLCTLLDASIKRLDNLIGVAQAYGLTECVFSSCRWNDDIFICFGCTKE